MSDGLTFGPLLVRWNGLLLALGISIGALLAGREARQRDYDPSIIYDLFYPLLIWGTIGARLWHILTPPLSSVQLGLTTYYYLTHPLDALAFWVGGLGLPGAFLGGGAALFFFVRRHGLSFWVMADMLAPGLALAQAIGRLGNYFNQEIYGLPSSLPWGIFIEPAYRLGGYETIQFFHPLFAYEMILNLANFIFLLWLSRRFPEKLRAGDLFLGYLGIYSILRFFLEYLRLDVSLVQGLNANQVFFGALSVCIALGLYARQRAAREL